MSEQGGLLHKGHCPVGDQEVSEERALGPGGPCLPAAQGGRLLLQETPPILVLSATSFLSSKPHPLSMYRCIWRVAGPDKEMWGHQESEGKAPVP